MSVINKIEELDKNKLLCKSCEKEMAEIFIVISIVDGAAFYSHCRKCALDLAISILEDYGTITNRRKIQG